MVKLNIKTSKKIVPMCYAYTTPEIKEHDGWTKIGFTEQDVETRIKQQTQTADVKFVLEWKSNAIYEDGSGEVFHDTDFHAYLKKNNIERKPDTEWFKIFPKDSKEKFYEFKENRGILETKPVMEYKLRNEQFNAVSQTKEFFESHKDDEPEFLWNAKPRFGKTLSTYDLCKQISAKKVLIVTNRPAIANSWYADYERFLGTDSGYYFVSQVSALKSKEYVLSREEYLNKLNDGNHKGCIEFVSLQDLKGSIYFGGNFDKLKEIKDLDWDLLVIDEAHEGIDTYKTDVAFDQIKRKYTLHLSGTPFKALANNKFEEKAIFNWTYADEQNAKRNWDNSKEEENPYQNLPQLNLYTYKMSDIIEGKVKQGCNLSDDDIREYAFDLNEFFSTNESGSFKYDEAVDKFLDALIVKSKFPFSTQELRDELNHTFWFLDRVDSVKALAKKLKVHPIFKNYEIIVAAGDGKLSEDEERENAFNKVVNGIKNHEKTITLSVGQLTTGITIPEWTAVLMLGNVKSPALYMQTAFRSQNPCVFHKDRQFFRKENAYVFDFDPARTLEIVEKFANDLSINTTSGQGDSDTRKQNVRELLNFFPVYGEDENGEMIALNAEQVLSIPRKIHAQEVVQRGFMSNFLFQNIGNIFNAPQEVVDIIKKFEKTKEPLPINQNTKEDLSLNEDGEVELSQNFIIGQANEIFGDKIYESINKDLVETVNELQNNKPEQDDEKLKELKDTFKTKVEETFVDTIKSNYKNAVTTSSLKKITQTISNTTNQVFDKEYGNYKILQNQTELERKKELETASDFEKDKINELYDLKVAENKTIFISELKNKLPELIQNAGNTIIERVETDKRQKEKKAIEDSVRDHLRGFSRTIPSFLMAYGNENTTLENFDTIIPDNVFKEVTSISLEEFRFLRDGGDYKDEKTGKTEHFEGHLFDPIVFNDSIKEFLNLKIKLSNYFDESNTEDIFDYIPPQKTNQIFTPKKVVKKMVDNLEKECPDCFTDPDKTFIDLYMKSGLYITEIVKQLYNNTKLIKIYPNSKDRLKHIFEKQVYGLAPTEIIYRIAISYILGFDNENFIQKHNLKQVDTLPLVQNDNLDKELDKIFG